MAAVTKKCYKSNTSKIILFDMYSNSGRKYEWIEYEDGTRLGRKTHCPSEFAMQCFDL